MGIQRTRPVHGGVGSGGNDGLAGFSQPGYASGSYYGPSGFNVNNDTGTRVNGAVDFSPIYISRGVTVDRLAVWNTVVGSAGSLARLGIFLDANGLPGTVVVDGGTVATDSGTGIKTVTVSTALSAGWYWLAYAQQGAPSPNLATVNLLRAPVVTPVIQALSSAQHGASFTATGVTGAFADNPVVTLSTVFPVVVLIRAA